MRLSSYFKVLALNIAFHRYKCLSLLLKSRRSKRFRDAIYCIMAFNYFWATSFKNKFPTGILLRVICYFYRGLTALKYAFRTFHLRGWTLPYEGAASGDICISYL